jgi:hypothetical protein
MPALPAPAARRPGPGLGLSLIVAAVGLLIGIVSVVAIVIPLVGVFTSDVYTVPGEIHLHLKDARYTVYQRSGRRSPFGISNPDDSTALLTPNSLTVTAPDDSTVPVVYDDRTETITRGTSEYTSSLTFDPPSGGDYVLQFTNRVPTTVIVARSVSDAIRGVLVWFGVGALGGAILLAGIVMWIVGAVRRGRAKRAGYAAAWGAPGWYVPNQQWGPPAAVPGYPPAYPPGPQPPPAYPPPPPHPGPPPSNPPPPPPADAS